MAETFLMILEGGPFPGEYQAPSSLSWPLVETVVAKDYVFGAYVKVFESKGKASKDGDTVRLRGAKYEWDADAKPFAIVG